MASKKITIDHSETGITTYAIIRREADDFLLNDVDGSFASAPVDPYLSLAEDTTIKGRYEVSEGRTVWDDGEYLIAVYKQSGGSPAPGSDTIIGSGLMYVLEDAEVKQHIENAEIHDAELQRRLMPQDGSSLTYYKRSGDVLKNFANTKAPLPILPIIERNPT